MTISTDDNEVSYTGNSVTTVFSFSRLFYDEDHVQVYLDNVLQTSGYTVSGVGTTGGNVTFTSAPGTAAAVLIRRVVPYRQETDFENNDGNPSDVTEKQFDLVVMQTQQLNEGLGRAITVPIGDTATDLELPSVASRAGGVLYFDGDGNVVITTASDSASAAAAAASASAASSSASAAAASAVTAEAAAVGIKWRPQVKAATTANITLSGAQTIDGISCVAGDRVLVKDQSTTANNGIYIVASGSWTRATDADTWAELVSLAVSIEQGSTLADTQWICTSNSGGTLGVTAVTFAGFLTTPRDSSVTYAKIDPNAVATTANVVSGAASKIVSAAVGRDMITRTIAAQNTTSGNTITFTGIPTDAVAIHCMFTGLSSSGSGLIKLRAGSGSLDSTSTYISNTSQGTATAAGATEDGISLMVTNNAAYAYGGIVTFRKQTGNVWCASGTVADNQTGGACYMIAARKSFSGAVDRVGIVTPDTFDAGSMSVHYEIGG